MIRIGAPSSESTRGRPVTGKSSRQSCMLSGNRGNTGVHLPALCSGFYDLGTSNTISVLGGQDEIRRNVILEVLAKPPTKHLEITRLGHDTNATVVPKTIFVAICFIFGDGVINGSLRNWRVSPD